MTRERDEAKAIGRRERKDDGVEQIQGQRCGEHQRGHGGDFCRDNRRARKWQRPEDHRIASIEHEHVPDRRADQPDGHRRVGHENECNPFDRVRQVFEPLITDRAQHDPLVVEEQLDEQQQAGNEEERDDADDRGAKLLAGADRVAGEELAEERAPEHGQAHPSHGPEGL
jgi:hypothetical protein